MSLFKKIKLGKTQASKLSKMEIDSKIKNKVRGISATIFIVEIIPAFIILISLYRFLSPTRLAFYIAAIIFVLGYILIMGVNSIISVKIYKELTKDNDDEVAKFFKEFDLKAYFLYSIFNIGTLSALVIISVALTIFKVSQYGW